MIRLLTTSLHWFRLWLSAAYTTQNCLNKLGLSRVTDYPWVVRFSEVTGYKFTNRLTGSCTDDLLETWSCQNHEKVEETPINPSCKWAKMHLLSVLGSETGPREPVNWHFLPLEVAWGQVAPWWRNWVNDFKQKVVFFTRNIVHEIKNNFELSSSLDESIPIDSHHNLSLLPCSQSLCFRFG